MNKLRKVLIVILCLLAVGSISLYVYNNRDIAEQIVQENKIEEIREEVKKEKTVDFEALKEENPDTHGWIEIKGTVVNYPIVQRDDVEYSEFYLNHNFDGTEGYPGCIFTQACNNKDFEDPVTVMYGHRMNDGSMFGDLGVYYKDLDSLKENSDITIYTPDGSFEYKVFAACTYDDRLIPASYGNFQEEGALEEYVKEVIALSRSNGVVNDKVEVRTDDKIIVLSTCIKDRDEQRFIVNAVRVDE